MKKKIVQHYIGRIRRTVIVEGDTEEELEDALLCGSWEESHDEVVNLEVLEDESWHDYEKDLTNPS